MDHVWHCGICDESPKPIIELDYRRERKKISRNKLETKRVKFRSYASTILLTSKNVITKIGVHAFRAPTCFPFPWFPELTVWIKSLLWVKEC